MPKCDGGGAKRGGNNQTVTDCYVPHSTKPNPISTAVMGKN